MAIKIDRRSLILTQLDSILSGLTITLSDGVIPAGHYCRNRDQLPKEMVPGFILLDADETKDPRFPQNSGRSTPSGPGMMKMTPEIYVVLNVRQPKNVDVGEDLIIARSVIIPAVLRDPTLLAITGTGGSIVYDGCYTDLARNRQMKGQMGLSFTFGYPFIPGEFLPA